MEYKIVYANASKLEKSKKAFEENVNNEIKNGWKLQGGVASLVTGHLFQAMVKE